MFGGLEGSLPQIRRCARGEAFFSFATGAGWGMLADED
jgi:hypothetical protein